MVLNGRVYQILKWLLIIVVPAAMTCFGAIVAGWHIELPMEAIVITVDAICTFIGACIGISNHNYYKDGGEE